MSFMLDLDSNEEYLNRALLFLKKYQWIFKSKNTDILTEKVLLNFLEEWKRYFNNISFEDFHRLLLGHFNSSIPLGLKLFTEELHELKISAVPQHIKYEKPIFRNLGLSQKKKHEILLLAPVIDDICKQNSCDLVVEVGSGLGYLSHLLYEFYGYQVLGLEVSKKFIDLAYVNQSRHHPTSKNNVIFSELFVDEHCSVTIEKLVTKNFGNRKKLCITGLHACADLSVTVLKLFKEMEIAKALVIMPCCYHRIMVREEQPDKTYFKNFPCSTLLSKLFTKYDAYSYLRLPFLRLACQQSLEAFLSLSREELEKRSQECMFRAILQLVAQTKNCSVRRLKRKSGKLKTTDIDEGFEAYLNNLPSTHELEILDVDGGELMKIADERFLSGMREKWREQKGNCCLVSALSGFQAVIQSVCENVVLLDRVEFLKEKAFPCCVRKITNDRVSPRCWALIAQK